MRLLLILAATATLGGCAATVLGGNPAGGMVDTGTGLMSTALKKANDHCQQYGKVSRISSTSLLGDTITFDCVAP